MHTGLPHALLCPLSVLLVRLLSPSVLIFSTREHFCFCLNNWLRSNRHQEHLPCARHAGRHSPVALHLGGIPVSDFQRWDLRFREVKNCVQGHTTEVIEWDSHLPFLGLSLYSLPNPTWLPYNSSQALHPFLRRK